MVIENNATAKTLSWIMFGGEALHVLYDLRWMLVLIVVLVLGDFWFGVYDSIHKKEDFRFSRAGRRTCNKLVDYITYLLVGTHARIGYLRAVGMDNTYGDGGGGSWLRLRMGIGQHHGACLQPAWCKVEF